MVDVDDCGVALKVDDNAAVAIVANDLIT